MVGGRELEGCFVPDNDFSFQAAADVLTWLNLRVKATTLGAELCFSFLFQPQLESSWKKTNKKGWNLENTQCEQL